MTAKGTFLLMVFAAVFVLIGSVGVATAQMNQEAETGPGIEGTTWRWSNGNTVQFLKDGQVRFSNSARGGHWKLDGDTVTFDLNGFTLFEVVIAGDKMTGTWRRLKGEEITASTELIKVQ